MMPQGRQDKSIIQRLFEAARRNAPLAQPEPCQDYDWSSPHHFTPDALAQAERLCESSAATVGRALSAVLSTDADLVAMPLRQVFAEHLRGRQQTIYSMAIISGDRPCGALSIGAADAIAWVARLLGGSADGAGERELSMLEQDLLVYVLSAAMDGVNNAVKEAIGGPLRRGEQVTKGLAIELSDGAEFCIVGFARKQASDKCILELVIESDILHKGEASDEPAAAAPAHAKLMMEHVQRAGVRASAWMNDLRVSIRDIMSLDSGDVILFNGPMLQPAQVRVQGKPVFDGLACSSGGHLAVQMRSGLSVQPGRKLAVRARPARSKGSD